MNCQLQVVTHSVRDIDEAVAFYTGPAGFTLDVELPPAAGFRAVQVTPPDSACSIQPRAADPAAACASSSSLSATCA